MVYLLAPHSSALQTVIQARFHWSIIHRHSSRQDTLQAERCHWASIGWHVSCKLNCTHELRTPQGIVSTFEGYKNALKNTLLNKFAIETPDNKIQEVTLKMVQKNLIIFLVLLWIMPQYMVKEVE